MDRLPLTDDSEPLDTTVTSGNIVEQDDEMLTGENNNSVENANAEATSVVVAARQCNKWSMFRKQCLNLFALSMSDLRVYVIIIGIYHVVIMI